MFLLVLVTVPGRILTIACPSRVFVSAILSLNSNSPIVVIIRGHPVEVEVEIDVEVDYNSLITHLWE